MWFCILLLLQQPLFAQDNAPLVGYMPTSKEVAQLSDQQKVGAVLYVAGALVGAHFLLRESAGKRDAGWLFLGAGVGGGWALMAGDTARERKLRKKDTAWQMGR